MLVVLAVLATLTIVAVESLAPVASQARYDATLKTLGDLRSAVVGPPSTVDSTQIVSGFVADVGRVPLSLAELLPLGDAIHPVSDSALQPLYTSWQEPWAANVPSGTVADVTLASGWKGPYLATPVGQAAESVVNDGWGRPLNGPSYFGGVDWTIWSSGPNGVDDSTLAGAISGDDIPLVLFPTDYSVQSVTLHIYEYNYVTMTITRPTLAAIAPYDSVSVFAFSVQNGQFQLLNTVTWSGLPAQSFDFTLSPVPVNMGPIVVQAFHNSGSVFANGTITRRCPPTVLMLRPCTSVDRTIVMQ
jgi:hypothetical protein